MKQANFEICYPLDQQSRRYLAPQLLNDQQPHYDWDAAKSLKFRFQYEFMPEGIVTRLMVRLNALIAKRDKDALIWRRGVILEQNNCRAKVIEEENRQGLKVIDIAVMGDSHQRKFLLHKVRDEIEAIHRKWFKNIQSEQMIPCNCHICEYSEAPTYFEFSQLKQYQDEGKRRIDCCKERIKAVEVMSLLEGMDLQNRNSQSNNTRYSATTNRHNKRHSEVNSKITENNNQDNAVRAISYTWVSDVLIAILSVLVILGFLLHLTNLSPLESILISLIAGVISGYFNKILRKKKSVSIQHSYHNTARFVLGFVLVNNSSFLAGRLNAKPNILDQEMLVSLQWGEPLNISVTSILLIFSGFMFYLGHTSNINANTS